MPMKVVKQLYDYGLGMFITPKVAEVWKEYSKRHEQQILIGKKTRFVFEPNEEEKILYKATLPQWIDNKCLECSLLAFCFFDFKLILKGMECKSFSHWRFLRTISWNKHHKYNPELRKIGVK